MKASYKNTQFSRKWNQGNLMDSAKSAEVRTSVPVLRINTEGKSLSSYFMNVSYKDKSFVSGGIGGYMVNRIIFTKKGVVVNNFFDSCDSL